MAIVKNKHFAYFDYSYYVLISKSCKIKDWIDFESRRRQVLVIAHLHFKIITFKVIYFPLIF